MKAEKGFFDALFDREMLDKLFPPERTDQFFDALLGDAAEGAYDIRLAYKGLQESRLNFELELHQRPGKCLVCSLTYGLPTVFSRHPVINIQGVVDQIARHVDGRGLQRDGRDPWADAAAGPWGEPRIFHPNCMWSRWSSISNDSRRARVVRKGRV